MIRSTARFTVIAETNPEKTAVLCTLIDHEQSPDVFYPMGSPAHHAVIAHLRTKKARYFSEAQVADDVIQFLRNYHGA